MVTAFVYPRENGQTHTQRCLGLADQTQQAGGLVSLAPWLMLARSAGLVRPKNHQHPAMTSHLGRDDRAPRDDSRRVPARLCGYPPLALSLQGVARFKFAAGDLQEFKRLSAQCIEIVRSKDTGTLQFEIYLNDDQSEAILLERYRDSDALIQHGKNLGELAEAIVRTGWVAGELIGQPSAELEETVTTTAIRIFRPFLSMQQPTPRREEHR